MQIGTIAILIIALLVIVAIVMGTDNTIEFFKRIFNLFGAKHKDATVCDRYTTIKGEQDMLDLIYYVKKGYCGGERPDDIFTFTIDTTPSPSGGVKFSVGMRGDNACGPPYFCGGHNCNLIAYPDAPEDNPVYLQFGDVEYSVVGKNCEYEEDWAWLESQNCIGSDVSDLIIGVHTPIMGVAGTDEAAPCDYSSPRNVCINQEEYFFSNTVTGFALKNFSSTIYTEPWSGTKYTGAWGIRRAGKDVVICTIMTEKK